MLDECFADLLKGLVFDDQVLDWIVEALHQSHARLGKAKAAGVNSSGLRGSWLST